MASEKTSRENGSSIQPSVLADSVPEKDLARQLKKTPRALRDWRQKCDGPPFFRVGRDIYYPIDGVREWLRSRIVVPVRAAPRPSAPRPKRNKSSHQFAS
jgi:hypothetical protein